MGKAIKINTTPVKKNFSILFVVIAFCLPVLLYLQTVNFGFSYFDDDGIIINNIKFLSDFSNAPHAFLTDAFIIKMSHFYRPLQTLTYMTDIQLSGGNNAWMYHFSNILLLGSISSILFLFLRLFSIPPKLALAGTLIYCMHPLFVSSVALIPTRGELLMILFSLLAFYFLAVHIKTKNKIFMLLHWISFTLALFSKETAVLLPLLFAFYIFNASNGKGFEKKFLILVTFYLISGISWYWLRSKAIGDYSNPNDITGFAAVILNIRSIPEALVKFFIPTDIAPIPGFSIFNTLVGSALIVLIIFLFFKNEERTKNEKLFCLSWFLLLIIPPMFYKHPYIDYMDHRFFLPLIGILLFFLFMFPKKWLVKGDVRNLWIYVAVIVFLSSFTIIKSRPYSDPLTFYNSAISNNPNSAIAYYNRAYIKSNKDNDPGAIEDYSKAIVLFPNYVEAYYSRALSESKINKVKEAIDDYSMAVSYCPTYYQAYFGRGNVKNSIGDYKGAIDDFDKAISIHPEYSDAYNNRGLAKASIGNYSDAIKDYNKAIAISPSNELAYYNRGSLKNVLHDYENAVADFDKAISIRPDYAEAYNNRGVSYYSSGKIKEAISSYSKAIELDPEYTDAYYNRALAEYYSKDITAALADCENILKMDPNDKRALILKTKALQRNQK
jgi:tetratricopeptide (TPR) repeat protein